jgi:hypothetical protein
MNDVSFLTGQSPMPRPNFGGVGLGLAITRKLARMMGAATLQLQASSIGPLLDNGCESRVDFTFGAAIQNDPSLKDSSGKVPAIAPSTAATSSAQGVIPARRRDPVLKSSRKRTHRIDRRAPKYSD